MNLRERLINAGLKVVEPTAFAGPDYSCSAVASLPFVALAPRDMFVRPFASAVIIRDEQFDEAIRSCVKELMKTIDPQRTYQYLPGPWPSVAESAHIDFENARIRVVVTYSPMHGGYLLTMDSYSEPES